MVTGKNLKAKGIRKCSVHFYGENKFFKQLDRRQWKDVYISRDIIEEKQGWWKNGRNLSRDKKKISLIRKKIEFKENIIFSPMDFNNHKINYDTIILNTREIIIVKFTVSFL